MRVSALAVVPLMAVGAATAVALVAFAPGFFSAAALLLVAAFFFAGITPTILGVAGAAQPDRTGTVFGLMFTLSVAGAMVLPWVGGHLAAALGVRVVMVLGAFGFLAVVLLALAARRLGRSESGE